MKNSLTKKLTIFIIILTVAVFVFGYFLNHRIASNLERLAELRVQVAESQDVSNIVNVKQQVATALQSKDLLNSYLVDNEGSIAFIEAIEELARQKGVAFTVQDVSMSEDADGSADDAGDDAGDATGDGDADNPSYGEFVMQAGLQSTWTNVMEFLILIENLPYYINITDLRLSSASKGSTGQNEWSASIALRAVTR